MELGRPVTVEDWELLINILPTSCNILLVNDVIKIVLERVKTQRLGVTNQYTSYEL